MKSTSLARWPFASLPAAALVLALSACGGGSDGASGGSTSVAPSDEATVPGDATSSVQRFVDYLSRQSATDDTIEPLKLQQQLPPTDDTIEPTPLG